MATDPRIRFDVTANADGGGAIDQLATSLEKLDHALDPAAAARAQELGTELARLGAQEAAVARFRELSAATEKAAADLTSADAAVAALRAEIDASGTATTAQAGRLERLGTAASTARTEVAAQTAALEASRGRLAALGLDAEQAAKAEGDFAAKTATTRAELAELGKSLQGVNARALVEELQQLGQQQAAVAQLRDLGAATEKARTSLTAAEAAAQAYAQRIAGVEAPTAAQVNTQQRLGFAVDDARAKFTAQAAALEAAGAKLQALGVETTDLAAAEEHLRTAAQGTLEQVQQLGAQQAAVARFQELAAATAKASAALGQSVSAVAEFRAAMSSATAPTEVEVAELDRLVSAAHAAQAALGEQSAAQTHAAEVARAAGVSLESLSAAQARGRDQAAATATAAGQVANAYQRVGAAAVTSGEQQSVAATQTATVLETLKGQLGALQQIAGLALGGTIVGGLAKEIGHTADEYANLSARIKIATGDGAAFAQALQGVFAVAQRTGTAVDDVAKLFVKLEQAGQKLGLTNQDALRLTETITQATQLSGEAAESANAAITQFAQGLSAGVLRGQDLNSVLEQAPRLAKALADGLGFTTAELKKLGEAGSLTAQQVIAALQGQSAAVQREFDQLPPTIGRAITSLSNNWTAYVGQVDKATGASATAAKAIIALGNNLETIGALLFSAGKAAAAYAAINLARTFLANAAAAAASAEAKAAETAATQANTAATVANSAAKTANASATAAAGSAGAQAAVSTGVFATALSSLKLFSLVGIVTNFREIGTAIGEGAAKLLGYDKPLQALEIATKADELAARANAQAKAELAQKTQMAADKALGLNDQSRKLIGTFDEEKTKGEETAVALKKVSDALELKDLSGITNGITALDALAQRGKITGAQLHDALSAAIQGVDLSAFAISARAAFDSSENGARRLKEALDAIATESLRRAGTSLEELTTGFSAGATKAVNDVDALNTTLQKLGVTGNDAARLLGAALDKATEAAGTERAVRGVMDRFVELGKQGVITGQQVSDGLAKAQEKIDALTPGIQGLAEAARKFGTDVPELMAGVSKAFQDSVNEVTRFGDELVKAGVSAQRASPLLLQALDQRIAAAKTTEEVALLRAETEKLGASGKLMGGDYTAALDKIKAKAAELTPAMRQLQQDAELLGIKIGDSTSAGAERAIAAYERIKTSGKASQADIQAAFVATANKAIEAANGIVPEWVKVEAAYRGVSISVNEFGQAAVSAAGSAVAGMQAVGSAVGVLQQQINAAAGSLDALSAKETAERNASVKANPIGQFSKNADGSAVNILTSPTKPIPEGYYFDQATFDRVANQYARSSVVGSQYTQYADPNDYIVRKPGVSAPPVSVRAPAAPAVSSPAPAPTSSIGTGGLVGTSTPASVAPSATAASTSHTVTINLADKATTVQMASAASANALVGLLSSLDSAKRAAGY